ncbi:MAG TPA: UvrD-helicase domain-containing protein [Candidatus Limnocylindria bacterium]|nr:UvrD-helicase domain-containing protein [Candidatus Limnocylindria bacterium]
MRPDPILDVLNPEQRAAVTHPAGPLLILAGAGSGKTRVLTHRIAYLVRDLDVPARKILAVTFTNKAAKEMRGRLQKLLGDAALADVSAGTFHAFCARLLRRDGPEVGLDRGFAIYDTADQRALLRQAMGDSGVSERLYSPGAVGAAISAAKNELRGPADLANEARGQLDRVSATVWRRYEALLKENNAVDFDDLLVLPCRLFETSDRALEKWQDRFDHILVDEYQDTNRAQYVLLRYLAGATQNLCVVGDDDQSVFSWRGADVRNILDFERDYPNATVVKLEQNYRSTQRILDAAHSVVRNNAARKEKKLWTERTGGDPVTVVQAHDEHHEAETIAREIERLRREGLVTSARDVAVLYRTNAQSRAIEDVFRGFGLAYQVVGGVSFYARREVKDVLAYLRLLQNPVDSVAIARVLNTPPRGIGAKGQAGLAAFAKERGAPIAEALLDAEQAPEIPKRQAAAMVAFGRLLARIRDELLLKDLPDIVDEVVRATGYGAYLKDGTEGGEERYANVLELRTIAEDYVNLPRDEQLPSFMEEVALVSDVDEFAEAKPAATLITMHAVKGLEFPIVFVTGMEEGVFPHNRSLEDERQLEEERRLCYVAITRAMHRCYLTFARRRQLFGRTNENPPSRFLRELPEDIELRGEIETEERDRWEDLDWERGRERYEERRAQLHAAALADLPPTWSGRGGREPSAAQVNRAARVAAVGDTRFRAGDHVVHPAFGAGIVVSSAVRPDDEEVTVAFAGKGVKKLMASFAGLTKV